MYSIKLEPRTFDYGAEVVVVVLEMARCTIVSKYPLARRKNTNMQLYA
jgi:hypothetical protein